MTTPVLTTTIDTPLGPMRLTATDQGLRSADWGQGESVAHRSQALDHPATGTDGPDPGTAHDVLVQTADQLREYFSGTRTVFDVPLDPVGSQFQRRAWLVLRGIPYGETISYGEQARRLGDPRTSRAVGGANARNPIAVIVPCHRVIASSGALTGFAAGLDRKRWLLAHESGLPS